MNKTVKSAHIGMKFGMSHIEGALAYGADIAAICDIDEENLKLAGERYGISEEKRIADYRELLCRDDIDIVTIAVPDQQHCKISCEFLNAGINVLCEKPLALTREDCEKIVRAQRESGTKFMIGQICRFTPSFEKAKEIISSGEIGEIYFAESEYAHDYGSFLETWRAEPDRHGVIGGGCHAVDLLRWLVGDPVEVFAYGMHKLLPMVIYDDATIAVMKFDEETAGKVFVSTGCKRDYTMRTVIYGTKGTIICDNTSPSMTLFRVDEHGITKEPESIEIPVNSHNAAKEFEVFADAVLNGKAVETDALEGAKTVEVCRSIVKSSVTGEIVRPDYNF